MDIHENIWFYIPIFILATVGFSVAWYIRHHKKNAKVLVCPLNMDCHGVIHSDYSKFLGIPVEFLGMFYYGAVALGYLFMIILPFIYPSGSIPGTFGLYVVIPLLMVASFSFFAFIFSLYLIGVQIFILKKGCSWCIISAIISALIFILRVIYSI